MIKVIPFIYNDHDDLCSNTYVLVDEINQCIVIDPSKNNKNLVNFLVKNQYDLKAVLLTHGHIDHFNGLEQILEHKNVNVYISFDEEKVIRDYFNNGSLYINGQPKSFNGPLTFISDKETISVINTEIVAFATPYHTIGSMVYYVKENETVFTGDSLFKRSIGRSDFPTGNSKQIKDSLSKILSLPKNTKVYPGHGPFTTIEDELDIIKFV